MDENLSFLGGLPEGLLTPEQQAAAQTRARQAAALQLGLGMIAGAQGQRGAGKPGLAQIIGQAGPGALQAYQTSFDQTLKNALTSMQLAEMRRKQTEQEQLRRIAPQLFQVSRAEPTTGPFDLAGTGPVPEQPITGVQINRQMLPALASLGPAGMEYASQIAQFEKSLRPERVTLKPGEQIIEPETGRVVAKVAPMPDKVDLGTHVGFYDPQNPAKLLLTLPKGKDPKDLTATELQVGGQFNTQAAPFITIGQSYKKIEAAAKNPSPAGDISLIFGYMKLLDPTSVVREGEFATAQNSGSVPDNIWGAYNKALTGEGLTAPRRQDFLNQARNLIASQKEIYDQTVRPRFESIVQSGNLNKSNVMFDPFAGIDLTKPAKPAPPTTGTIPSVRQMMDSGATGGITVRRIAP